MVKKYVIVEAGLEYNDETYDVTAPTSVNNKLLSSKEEAVQTALAMTRERIAKFPWGEVDYYNTDAWKMNEVLAGLNYREAEEKLREMGEWNDSFLPVLFHVFEVEV